MKIFYVVDSYTDYIRTDVRSSYQDAIRLANDYEDRTGHPHYVQERDV